MYTLRSVVLAAVTALVLAGSAVPAAAAATPSYTLALGPATVEAIAGGDATTTVTLTAFNGYTGAPTLTAEHLPAGVSISFSPATVSAGHPSVATLHTTTATALATSTFPLDGVEFGGVDPLESTPITLKVVAFNLTMSPTSGTTVNAGLLTTQITLTGLNGFHSTVHLESTSIQVGVSFSAVTLTAGQTVTATLFPPQIFGNTTSQYAVTLRGYVNDRTEPTARLITYNLTNVSISTFP